MTASWSISIADRTACSASSEYGGRRSRYGSRAGGGAIENSTGELDIFPSWTLPPRVSQQSRGMVGDDQGDAVVSMHLPAKLADRKLRREECLRREGA